MKKSIIYALIGASVIFFGACNNSSKKQKENKKAEETVVYDSRIAEPVREVYVTEDWVYTVPIVTAPQTPSQPTTPAKNTKTTSKSNTTNKNNTATTHNSYTRVNTKDLDNNLSKNNIKQMKKVDTSCFCFNADALNTTKTVTSYGKNGKEVMKVVSNPTNPDVIDYIVFTDKDNNTDVYGVNVGLTGKEARHLRKDLKHFERNGKVFLYNEESSILYETDCRTSDGKVITDNDIDNARITSVIWKDKADKPFVNLKERK